MDGGLVGTGEVLRDAAVEENASNSIGGGGQTDPLDTQSELEGTGSGAIFAI